jgi:hypothetical protein
MDSEGSSGEEEPLTGTQRPQGAGIDLNAYYALQQKQQKQQSANSTAMYQGSQQPAQSVNQVCDCFFSSEFSARVSG